MGAVSGNATCGYCGHSTTDQPFDLAQWHVSAYTEVLSGMAESVDEPARKKLRKGTHSCWQCRRRKIRCQFDSTDDSVCVGCRHARTKCQSQEEVVDETSNPNRAGGLAERVGRLESLLEAVIRKIDSVSDRLDHGPQPAHALEKVAVRSDIDVITPSLGSSNEAAPLLSLFNNAIFDRKAAEGEATGLKGSAMPHRGPSSSMSAASKNTSQYESQFSELRRSLMTMMPSQEDIKKILLATEISWAIWFDEYTDSSTDSCGIASFRERFSSFTTSHPSFIARALLLVTTSLQQLPPDFDYSELNLPFPPQELMEKQLSQTSALVTSNDELVGTLEGLECLGLQGVCWSNAGKPRRAWLCFRRALDIAQLMGLHRCRAPGKDLDAELLTRLRHVWWITFEADRCIAVLLGLPYGISNQHCDFADAEDETISREEVFKRKLSIIAGDIIDRDQAAKQSNFTATQEIDEKLERLARSMPDSWWETPPASWPTDPRTLARQNSRLMAQFWHYQMETLLHLPFMIRSATDHRFEYNKSICLKASREMIRRYFCLREQATTATFVCKVIDFQAFTSVVILILNLLGPQPSPPSHSLPYSNHSNDQDWQTVDRVISLLSDPSAVIDEAVATQGIKVIKTLSAIGRNLGPHVSTSGAMKLAIPYFGTISIARGSKFYQHPHPTPPRDATSEPTLQQLQKHNPEWNLVYPAATSRIPTAPVTLSRTPPSSNTSNLSDHTHMQNENQINNFVPANSQAFHIEFSPSCSLASSYIPPPAASATTATMDTNLNDFANAQDFQLTPEDERIMMQTFYELNQNVGENWNFSLEGMI